MNRIEQLRGRIAEVLGLPLGPQGGFEPDADILRLADDPARRAAIVLSRECLDLLEAYTRITDPEKRRRCLDGVREAALS